MTDTPSTWPTERSFLHAISTPLSTIGLELEEMLELAKKAEDSRLQDSVGHTQRVLDRVFMMIQSRRAQLVENGSPTSPGSLP